MKNNITELVFILDESGSMYDLKQDTIGGFNSMIGKQKEEDGQCFVSTVLFNTNQKVIHDREDLKNIKFMTSKDYTPGGGTALMDALGGAMKHIEMIHKYIRKEDVPLKTLFVIMTDGYENASHKYNVHDINKKINYCKEKYGWEFMFIGANIDSEEIAKSYGINQEMAVNYHADAKGSEIVYETINNAVHNLRKNRKIEKGWNAKIKKDYESRK